MKFGLRPLKETEVRIAQDEEQDVQKIYTTLPTLVVARNAFLGTVVNCPPHIEIKKFHIEQSELLEQLMEHYYLPFVQSIYDWIKMYGIYPWRSKKIPGTPFQYPYIPNIDAGYITTYLDDNGEQQFRYYPLTNKIEAGFKHDSRYKFRHKNKISIPGLNGHLRSDISTLLRDYRTLCVVQQSTDLSVYRQARPQHFFEYTPPKNNAGDDNLTAMETYGGAVAGLVQRQQEELRRQKITLRTSDLRKGIMSTIAQNKGISFVNGTGPITRSETHSEQWERENAGLLTQAIPLEPDYHYKAAQVPKVSVDLNKIGERFDQMVSAVMEYPLHLINAPSGNKGSHTELSLHHIRNRNKDWVEYLCQEVKHVFISLHAKMLQTAEDAINEARFKRRIVEMIEIEREIDVTMTCNNTTLTAERIAELAEKQYMEKETAARYMYDILGLPEKDLPKKEFFQRQLEQEQAKPTTTKQPLLKRQKKREEQ